MNLIFLLLILTPTIAVFIQICANYQEQQSRDSPQAALTSIRSTLQTVSNAIIVTNRQSQDDRTGRSIETARTTELLDNKAGHLIKARDVLEDPHASSKTILNTSSCTIVKGHSVGSVGTIMDRLETNVRRLGPNQIAYGALGDDFVLLTYEPASFKIVSISYAQIKKLNGRSLYETGEMAFEYESRSPERPCEP